MKKKLTIGIVSIIAAIGILALPTGCVTSKTSSVTPATTNATTGAVSPATTNEVTTVNTANLNLDCAALQLVGTPALIYAIQKDPSARPIVVDIQVALTGALSGANTNVAATINGLVGNNAALSASIAPLITAASSLEQTELAKYGNVAGVQITQAILQADLNIVNASLAAVPAQ